MHDPEEPSLPTLTLGPDVPSTTVITYEREDIVRLLRSVVQVPKGMYVEGIKFIMTLQRDEILRVEVKCSRLKSGR